MKFVAGIMILSGVMLIYAGMTGQSITDAVSGIMSGKVTPVLEPAKAAS